MANLKSRNSLQFPHAGGVLSSLTPLTSLSLVANVLMTKRPWDGLSCLLAASFRPTQVLWLVRTTCGAQLSFADTSLVQISDWPPETIRQSHAACALGDPFGQLLSRMTQDPHTTPKCRLHGNMEKLQTQTSRSVKESRPYGCEVERRGRGPPGIGRSVHVELAEKTVAAMSQATRKDASFSCTKVLLTHQFRWLEVNAGGNSTHCIVV